MDGSEELPTPARVVTHSHLKFLASLIPSLNSLDSRVELELSMKLTLSLNDISTRCLSELNTQKTSLDKFLVLSSYFHIRLTSLKHFQGYLN